MNIDAIHPSACCAHRYMHPSVCTATTGDPDDAAKWAKDLLKFTLWTPEDFDARVSDTDRGTGGMKWRERDQW